MIHEANEGGIVPRQNVESRDVTSGLEGQIRKILIDFPHPEHFKEAANGNMEHARIMCQRLMLTSVLLAVGDSKAVSFGRHPQSARNNAERAKADRKAKENIGLFLSAAFDLSSDFNRITNGLSPRKILKSIPARNDDAASRARARRRLLQAMLLVGMPGHWGTEDERIAFAAKASGEKVGTLRTRIRHWNLDKKKAGEVNYVPKFSDVERQMYSELEEKFRPLGTEHPPATRARFWAMVMFGRILSLAQR